MQGFCHQLSTKDKDTWFTLFEKLEIISQSILGLLQDIGFRILEEVEKYGIHSQSAY